MFAHIKLLLAFFFTIYRNTQRIDLHTEARYELRPTSVFFSSQAGIQRSFLDVQSLTGLYIDIRSGRIGHPKTGYVPRTANLFFRAKRGIRGRFVVKNSVLKCIWTYVRNGLSATKRDVDPNQSLYFFESGWDTEVVFGCSVTD